MLNDGSYLVFADFQAPIKVKFKAGVIPILSIGILTFVNKSCWCLLTSSYLFHYMSKMAKNGPKQAKNGPNPCAISSWIRIRIRIRSSRIRIQEKMGGFGFSWIRIQGCWIRIRIRIRDAWICTSLVLKGIVLPAWRGACILPKIINRRYEQKCTCI